MSIITVSVPISDTLIKRIRFDADPTEEELFLIDDFLLSLEGSPEERVEQTIHFAKKLGWNLTVL